MESAIHQSRVADRRWTMLGYVSLIVLTAAVYWPVHRFDFVLYDDPGYVLDNRHVVQGISWANLRYAFTSTAMANWHPLTWVSYLLDKTLFDLRPGAMHVENVVLHLVGGICLWRFLISLTGSPARSYVVAALFLCHPMHVESVAWISERKDVLSTLLLICAMWTYVQYCNCSQTRWRYYALMLVLFILSLMAKSMGVTLPAVLLLLDCWPLRRVQWANLRSQSSVRLIAEKIPLLIIAAAVSIVEASAQSAAIVSFSTISLDDRIENIFVCYVIYIVKLLAPTNLAILYPYNLSRPFAAVGAAVALLALILFFAIRFRQRKPYLLVGILLFLGTLVPVIGVVQVGSQAMADRYTYFPSIGFFIAAVWGINDVLGFISRNNIFRSIVFGVLIVVMSIIARIQVEYWQNTLTLFTHAEQVTDENWVPHKALGDYAFSCGDAHKAFVEFTRADQDRPNDAEIVEGLGNCWVHDDPAKAVTYLRRAEALAPSKSEMHESYAAALMKTGDLNLAEQELRTALRIDPESERIPLMLSKLMTQKKSEGKSPPTLR